MFFVYKINCFAEAEVAGDDSDDAKDKKSMAELESLEEECDFCVYDDIRAKLIAKGVPADEIVYIHDAKTEKQKADLFDKVLSAEHRNTVYEMQDKIDAFPDREKHYTSLLDALHADRETLRKLPIDEETKIHLI